MRLKNILKNISVKKIINDKNVDIKSITHISDDVVSGGMFICLKGENFNGNDYVDVVIENGVKCILTDDEIAIKVKSEIYKNIVFVVVENVREGMSLVAKNFYYNCVDKMEVVGIIGTSGKTTTSLMICQIMSTIDKNIGVIGTNGIFIGDIKLENKFTTPDPLELHYVFYQMYLLGVKRVVMEVSAQAIYHKKVAGIKFKYCVFTNISTEHLDFFGSMENYVKCKMNFFNKHNMDECVVNIDDFYGMELAYKLDIPCVSVGIVNPANAFAIDICTGILETYFTANILDEVFEVKSPFVGEFNIYNLLCAMTISKMWGVSHELMLKALKKLTAIPGRFNVFNKGNNLVVVDFAHTPDSIEKILSFVKKFAEGRIITVIGCVGYSDINKRIDIANACDKYSDIVIITTDNRGKTPYKDIANDMIRGMSGMKYYLIEDRYSAIEFGVDILKDQDVLMILGKGAEDFQKIDEERVSYSDLKSVENILKGTL